jgi:hypothetical protein
VAPDTRSARLTAAQWHRLALLLSQGR